ncbi:DUF1819 family protein [Methanothermobacter sp. THM-1]|uniref:DUF1819 family protein n=1 Tax=Methanothermobacter sp. THM-1 TaxID=2606911 RepID=UPI0013679036|nr:DUF1819 family protein [Methanothermobacter sp. THM-1]QHN06699.1 DUF1819 family protein [Methanothermobacter sp. THM-1]
MKYSAGIVSKSFWFLESRKTARYIIEGLKRQDIIELAVKENIYQVESEYRARRMASSIYQRLKSLPEDVLKLLVEADSETSRIIVLISIMKTDRLFFEFMHEVFRTKIITGDHILEDRDLNIFFEEKRIQSATVDKWVDSTIKRLKSEYIRMLREAGLLRYKGDKREILKPFIDSAAKKRLMKEDMAPYFSTLAGRV